MSGDEWTSFYHESQIWDSVLWIFNVWIFINWQSLLWGTGLLGEQLRDSAPRSFIEGLDLSSAMLQQASGSCLGWFKFETFKRFSIGNADEMVKFNLTANIANLARFEFRAVNFKDIIWKSVLQRDSKTRVCGCMYLWIAADATHQQFQPTCQDINATGEAKKKGCYDRLHHQEISDFLQAGYHCL